MLSGVPVRLGVNASFVPLTVTKEREWVRRCRWSRPRSPSHKWVPTLDAPVAARDLLPVFVAALDCVGVRVAARECDVLMVGAFDCDADLVGAGLLVDTLVPDDVGDTATHAPHVNPGNPGAPGMALVATYPTLQVPPHATPHAVYPAGQGVHPAPDLYCPTLHAGVDNGVAGERVWDLVAAGVRGGADFVTASSRSK